MRKQTKIIVNYFNEHKKTLEGQHEIESLRQFIVKLQKITEAHCKKTGMSPDLLTVNVPLYYMELLTEKMDEKEFIEFVKNWIDITILKMYRKVL